MDDGEGAGGQAADEEGTEEARGVSHGDGVDVVPGFFGVSHGFFYDWHHHFEMISGCNFRDDSAIFGENIDLGDDDIAQNSAPVFDNRGGGFVTRGFNSQN